MPTVPSLDPSQLVTPSQSSDFQGSSVVSATLLGQGAQQFSDAGAAISQASDAQSQIAVDVQNRINQTRVDDAMNAAQAQAYTLKFDPQTGYANKTGAAAITPDANGALPADAALQKLNDSAQDVRQNLTPAQQHEFDLRYGQLATQFHGEALAHEGTQTRQYSLDTNNSTIKLANDAAVQDYANAPLLDEHIQNAGSAAYKNAQVQGLQGPALVATVKTAQSNTVRAAWQSAIENGDIATASEIQKRYGSSLTADDAVHIDGTMKTAVDMQTGATVARSAVAPAIAAGTPAGQAFAANVSVESGGKQSAVSPKGAVGVAQVMPGTGPEAADAAGVPWDPVAYRTNAAYNLVIGRAYWAKQLAANGGDMAKADAAYNGGPGALQSAIDKANAAGTPNDWLKYMPPETQAYVPKVAAARQTGAGTATMPTKADVYANIDADPRITTPQARQFAYAQADKLFDAQVEAKKQMQTEAQAQALKTVYTSGGDLSQIQPATLANMNPQDIGALYDAAKKARTGVDFTSPALYQDIVTNQSKYFGMSDAQWYAATRPNLSASDFQTLTKQRADWRDGTSSQAPAALDVSTIKNQTDLNLSAMGLKPDLSDGSDDAARIGVIRQGVNQSILQRQQALGRKLNPSETMQAVDGYFRQTAINGSNEQTLTSATTGMFGAFSPTNNGAIPEGERTRIISDLKKSGVPNPSNGQILNAWRTLHSTFNQTERSDTVAAGTVTR